MSQIRFTAGPNLPPTMEMGGRTYALQCIPADAQGSNIAATRVVKNGATTLTAADSGALCVWSTAAGYTYTLPTASPGLWFDFVCTITITSSAAKVITASASEFILGTFLQGTDGTFTFGFHDANGTTIRAWSGNDSTTGGIKGDSFRLTAISTTQWVISQGIGNATGTEATPFATS